MNIEISEEGLGDYMHRHQPSPATLSHSKEEWKKFMDNKKRSPTEKLTLVLLKLIVALQALLIVLILAK